eukprot:3788990-Pyramimonas_sp.AAC.1
MTGRIRHAAAETNLKSEAVNAMPIQIPSFEGYLPNLLAKSDRARRWGVGQTIAELQKHVRAPHAGGRCAA